jgi:hypothetical protein
MRAEKLMPTHLKPVYVLLCKALQETYNGSLDTRRASAMASLAGALVRTAEGAVFEDRLKALEERIGTTRGRP